MNTAIRLSSKAYSAIRLLGDTSYKNRAKQLEAIGERGFALILYWNQIEAALKLMRYSFRIEDGWPDKLDFIRVNWTPLNQLKLNNAEEYESVLGLANSSLKNKRNEIVHEGKVLLDVDYDGYIKSAQWAIASLQMKVPTINQLRDQKQQAELKKTT